MGTDLAELYVQDFRRYEDVSGHNDLTLLTLFRRGLAKRVRSRINNMDTVPTTLRDWQDKAIQYDRQQRIEWRQEREARTHHSTKKPEPSSQTPRVNLPQKTIVPRPPYGQQGFPRFPRERFTEQRPPPYQYPPSTSGPSRPPPPPPRRDDAMDVDRARSQGLCFKCGKHGHIARNCPDRRGPAQARAFVQELNDEEAEVFTRELHTRQNPEAPPPQDFQNVQE